MYLGVAKLRLYIMKGEYDYGPGGVFVHMRDCTRIAGLSRELFLHNIICHTFSTS